MPEIAPWARLHVRCARQRTSAMPTDRGHGPLLPNAMLRRSGSAAQGG